MDYSSGKELRSEACQQPTHGRQKALEGESVAKLMPILPQYSGTRTTDQLPKSIP
jgi:hypothetical protein